MSQDHVLGTQDEVVVVAPWTAVGRIIGSGRKPGALLAPPLTSFVSWGDVGWLSSPQNSLFIGLTTSGPVFGDNAFRKVIRVKRGRRVGLWSSVTGVLIRRGRDTSSACLHTEAFWGHSEQEAVSKPRTEASGETKPAGDLSLDFQPLELWEISHSVRYFVMAALVD